MCQQAKYTDKGMSLFDNAAKREGLAILRLKVLRPKTTTGRKNKVKIPLA